VPVILAGGCLLLFLTFNIHSKSDIFNYHSEIWGDKAGYYVYLPAAFIYSFDASRFPSGIDSLTGNGFKLDPASKKVFTKYTCGVALMMSPFFLVTHELTGILDAPADGFSLPYHRMINIAAVVYLMFGLILWYRFLRNYYPRTVSLWVITFLFLGTNLYYYAVAETGMSHVYSFFLLSLYLFSSRRLFSSQNRSTPWTLITALAAAMIVVVKPVNIIFLPVALFLDTPSGSDLRNRSLLLFQWKTMLLAVLVVLIILLPQAIYWYHTYGRLMVYTYAGEGFVNLARPRVLEYLFSTNNGLLLYNPILLFGFTGLVMMLARRRSNGWILLVMLVVILYLFSSWWSWHFGCGYGNRSFTEYIALLALPFGYLVNVIRNDPRRGRRYLFFFLVGLLIFVNLKMIYSWDGCWYGGTWDWKNFGEIVFSAPK
jgi:hypothetical protein